MTVQETADQLIRCAQQLLIVAQVIRGVERDETGCGCWQIFCTQLEQVMNCKILTVEQWEFFKDKP